jgi:hypothetical protein
MLPVSTGNHSHKMDVRYQSAADLGTKYLTGRTWSLTAFGGLNRQRSMLKSSHRAAAGKLPLFRNLVLLLPNVRDGAFFAIGR